MATSHPWLIPALPLAAAAVSALLRQSARKPAAGLAIGAMAASFLLACAAFLDVLGPGEVRRLSNFTWLTFGDTPLRLGWIVDPLSAVMLVMVTFVSLLVFIYSVGYMAHDENFTRFFCFLSLFASAMLGLIISNSLLLLFICWELVGVASFLLIGFWYHKPSATAAAKKAFITTRIGDIGLLLGLLWLYTETGTLLCYDDGMGCLEQPALVALALKFKFGFALSTLIPLLIFCGPIGKSGQFPLHVWLPDAMEGPTPVSALIHAATMVAAGVFLVARVYPLMAVGPGGAGGVSTALLVVSWVGVITALFAAVIAVTQTDIKRILAYSTVSQLGFMMLGLGMGGVAVGMFHLITHAFFKALLFLGAGSVIHGCHEEQDIRKMGGLREHMPVTFMTYAIGMMALSGVPVFFSGFWSKDDILHAAHAWKGGQALFVLGLAGSFLTAFYMTRQMLYVFFGQYRSGARQTAKKSSGAAKHQEHSHDHAHGSAEPHESPAVMTIPLRILAALAIVTGFFGTPAWPWFQSFLEGKSAHFDLRHLIEGSGLVVMGLSTVVVAAGIGLGLWLYGGKPLQAGEPDVLEKQQPEVYGILRGKFYVDELYELGVIQPTKAAGRGLDFIDRHFWGGLGRAVGACTLAWSWLNRLFDEFAVNGAFDRVCGRLRRSSACLLRSQTGDAQHYLRTIAVAFAALLLWLLIGFGPR